MNCVRRRSMCLLGLAVALGTVGSAQTTCLLEAVSGDFNGDGRKDVELMDWDESTLTGRYRVALRSLESDGAGGFVYWAPWYQEQWLFGDKVRPLIGDIGGDGSDTVVFVAPYLGNMRVLPEARLEKVFYPGWGSGVLQEPQIGDIDGDGKDDLVFPFDNGGGLEVRVLRAYDAATNAWVMQGSASVWGAGVLGHVRIGDLDGDGREDLLFPFENGGLLEVRVLRDFDPATGAWRAMQGYSTQWGAGTLANVHVGDIDGDGRTDMIFTYGAGGLTEVRTLRGFDPGTGAWVRQGFSSNWGSGVMVHERVGDIDGDGKDDLLFPFANGGIVEVRALRDFDPSTGRWAMTGYSTTWGTGVLADPLVGDVDADGRDDLVLPWQSGDDLRVRTLRSFQSSSGAWAVHDESRLCVCCPDPGGSSETGLNCITIDDVIGSSVPLLGSTLKWTLTGARPDSHAGLLLGTERTPFPFGTCTIYPSLPGVGPLWVGGNATNGSGDAKTYLRLPNETWLVGARLFGQYAYYRPGVFASVDFTTGLEVVLGGG
ncbi:MAG: VCBS repeat-containing protein [Planctomycetota bacterium]